MYKLVIPGEPIGKGRPRLGKYTTYTPDKTRNYEAYIQYLFIDAYRDYKPIETAARAEVLCYYPIPKSFSKAKIKAIEEGKLRPEVKPDLDNILKIILDSLNKFAIVDDKIICEADIKKYYSNEPRVEVFIRAI